MADKKLTGFERLSNQELKDFIAQNHAAALSMRELGIYSLVTMLHDALAELDSRVA